ncbi:MAG TPA: hypothetical protein VNI57_04620 [Candidatus Saccharimonadales bacterium]|nr:hypothetical protein [Candidatus Saccharimonadales bacterium]
MKIIASRPATALSRLLLLLAVAGAATGALAAAGEDRGPLVAVPNCTTSSEGCNLDPATPDLNPAGCAATLVEQLGRRGIRAEAIGPGSVTCGEGSGSLILDASIHATCPAGSGDKLVMDRVLSVKLRMTLTLRDCFTGEVVGTASTERSLESGRRTAARDAIEELGHHTSERKIRRLHPETPIRWMKADVGGERSFEVTGGAVDISSSGINDLLRDFRMDSEKHAKRAAIDLAYNPWSSPGTRVAIGVEVLQAKADGEGRVDLKDIHRSPANNPGWDPNAPRSVNLRLGVVGIKGSVGQGLDVTLNQRLSVTGSIGYYILGTGLMPATLDVEGLPAGDYTLRSSSVMLSGGVRYEWRFTPHLELSAEYGYQFLQFSRPDRVDRVRFFPYNVDFTGPSARIGFGGRF